MTTFRGIGVASLIVMFLFLLIQTKLKSSEEKEKKRKNSTADSEIGEKEAQRKYDRQGSDVSVETVVDDEEGSK